MKKLLPSVLMVLVCAGFLALFSSGKLNIQSIMLLPFALLMVAMCTRPKSTGGPQNTQSIQDALGEFGSDAFTDDSQASQDFRKAVADFQKNMPKAALVKLNKLAPQCRSDAEKYAVAMVTAMVCQKLDDYKQAIVEYNRAVVLHPTSDVAMQIGACHQRLGQLRKARDSYEFALELDAGNIRAMSSLATAYVADGKYSQALDQAENVLELDETNTSALATCAICHGLLGNPHLSQSYTEKAANLGYSRKKIEETISALSK